MAPTSGPCSPSVRVRIGASLRGASRWLTASTICARVTAMPVAAAPDRIEAIRAFNRFYTGRIGVLREGLHDSPHPLPDARVLFELGRGGLAEVGELRRTLDMDAGQLSRLLARLDEQGLVARERSPRDGRR